MILRVLIIDDEEPARKLLRRLIKAHQDFEVIGEAASAAEALAIIDTSSPDLLLLDVRMPRGSGFQFLAKLENPPKVIFVTAFEEYARQAFDVAAADYLLKPVSAERLSIALDRVRQSFAMERLHGSPGELVVNAVNGIIKPIIVHDILSIRAAGNYTLVTFTDSSALTVYRSLSEWEQLLPGTNFVRADRSHLIHTIHIDRLETAGRDVGTLFFKGVTEHLELGRTGLARLKDALMGRETPRPNNKISL